MSDAPLEVRKAAEQRAAQMAASATSLDVHDDESYSLAARIRAEQIKPMLKELDRVFDPSIDAAKQALQVAKATKAEWATPLENADKALKARMDSYLSEKLRRQREEERRKQEEERKAAEEKALAEAAAREAEGKAEEAQEIIEQALIEPAPPKPIAAAVAPKVAGITTRTNWTYRVVDESKIARRYWQIDHVAIGKVVRAYHKEAEAEVGGIEAIEQVVT